MVEPVPFEPDEPGKRDGELDRDAEPPRVFRPRAGDADSRDTDGREDGDRGARRYDPWGWDDEAAERGLPFDRRDERGERRDDDLRDDEDFETRRGRRPKSWDDVAPMFPAQWGDLAEGMGLMQATFLRATAEVLRGLAAAADWEAARQERQRRGRPGAQGRYGGWDGYSGRDAWDGERRPRRERIYPE
jgi:hypothetical protein